MNCILCCSVPVTQNPVVVSRRWQTGSSSSSSSRTGWRGRGLGEDCHLSSLSIGAVGIGRPSVIPFIRRLRKRRERKSILYVGSVFGSNGKTRQRVGHQTLETTKGEIKAPLISGLTENLLHNAVNNDKSSLGECTPDFEAPSEKQRAGSDFLILMRRFWKVAAPYWSSEDRVQARLRLAAVLALTLATTGISVAFNFLGRDFYNALANKDQEQFVKQLLYYLAAFVGGIPVFVIRDYTRDKLALRWRAWMTKFYIDNYFENRTFYKIQSQSLIDNPDQRIVDDLNSFTSTALAFALALFNSTIDLISFSGILYGIYPPLFAVLIVYSIGGTALSVALGKGLVGLNFMQEKREADFRYGLVRVRENAESIAFYGGEDSEIQLLLERFKLSFSNYTQLLIASRNLDFFTSAYRYLIQLLPAAVVAPLFFAGKIEFGVINQSFSAFNHILSDFSIIVYQFQSISAFSAVIDRLGEFNELLQQQNALSRPTTFLATSSDTTQLNLLETPTTPRPVISIVNIIDSVISTSVRSAENKLHIPLLEIEHLTLQTPQYTSTLVEDLSLSLNEGEHLLVLPSTTVALDYIMGASGSGKTSLLRAIGGLWTAGKGTIKRHFIYDSDGESNGALKPVIDDEPLKVEPVSDLKVPVSNEVTINGSQQRIESELGPRLKPGIEKESSPKRTVKESLDECQQIFFLPQRPYMVLGSLRQQILYPTWAEQTVSILERSGNKTGDDSAPFGFGTEEKISASEQNPQPSDAELIEVLELVNLGHLMDGCDGLDAFMEWSSILSLGEQQRIAFARLLISKPRLALLDESTSALDEENEIQLYQEIEKAGITYVSVGHRSTLQRYHRNILKFRNSQADGTGRNWTIGPLVSERDQEVLGSPL